MDQIRECSVVLDRIDVSSYRNDPQNVVEDRNAVTVELEDNNESGAMAMEFVCEDDCDSEVDAAEFVLFASCYLLTKRQYDNEKKEKLERYGFEIGSRKENRKEPIINCCLNYGTETTVKDGCIVIFSA